jgi:hypothetical protein
MTFERLDFVYTPSGDVAGDVRFTVDMLGARLVFAIEDGGTRVAMLELTPGPPRVLFADHLDGDQPILVYRVGDLTAARADLLARGLSPQRSLEIPQGPLCSYVVPGSGRFALYQETRPGVLAHFAGRRDF